MESFRLTGDDKHIYLKTTDGRNCREELASVMKILNSNNCQILDRIVGPDYTLYPCKMSVYRFAVCDASVVGEGISLCVDDENTMNYLEKLIRS